MRRPSFTLLLLALARRKGHSPGMSFFICSCLEITQLKLYSGGEIEFRGSVSMWDSDFEVLIRNLDAYKNGVLKELRGFIFLITRSLKLLSLMCEGDELRIM